MASCFTCRSPSKKGVDKQGMKKRKGSPLFNQKHLNQVHLSVGAENVDHHDAYSDNLQSLSMRLENVVEERVGSTLYSWRTRQLRLESGHLVCDNVNSKNSKCKMIPLQLCMVRPLGKTTFKVVCATKYSLVFKAKHKEAMRDWVQAIQGGISHALSTYNEQPSSSASEHTGKSMLAALYRANPQNKVCADCNAKDPSWVSISLGAIMCIECSGVHRSLGSHISKVRSFELDKWNENMEMVKKLGNSEVNSVFERHIPFPREKPSLSSNRETRERFIVDKYVNKMFMSSAEEREAKGESAEAETCFTPTISKRLHSSEGVNKPTSHIGSDPFAMKTPYGAISPSFIRRGSLSFIKHSNNGNGNGNNATQSGGRRNSMFPQQTTKASTTNNTSTTQNNRGPNTLSHSSETSSNHTRRNSVFQTQSVRRGSVFQHNNHSNNMFARRNSTMQVAAF